MGDVHSLLVNTTHSEFSRYKPRAAPDTTVKAHSTTSTTSTITITTTTTASPAKTSIFPTLRDIKTLLEFLEEERTTWWNGKAKERQYWRETYQEDKITKINVVNNKTVEMIESLKARLGTFCRWSLGLEDGVEGLDGVVKESKDIKIEDKDMKMEG